MAYSHQLGLEMPGGSVKPRFERARDRCLNDAALNCVVLEASINVSQPYGSLRVRLPHDSIAAFEQDIFAPLPGETTGDAVLRSRSTTAEDLTQAIADSERRLAQLTDYRDRLTALLKRSDAKVEDLIKVQGELSKTQSEIEGITEQKRQLDERVATEIMGISFSARPTLNEPGNPIAEVAHDSARLISQSAANALRFTIQLVPWLPLIAIGWLVVRGLVRFVARRRKAASKA